MLKSVSFKTEPILKAHRYIVTVSKQGKDKKWTTKFHYCVNRQEVRDLCKETSKGAYIEIHKAQHNFVKGYVVE